MGRPKTISDEDLLAIAREVFTTHGAFGSTKDIASRAGISEAALFKRFATKAQLFMAAMVPPSPGIEPVLARATAAKTGQEGINMVAQALLDYFRIAIPVILPLVAQSQYASTATPNFQTSPATGLLKAVSTYIRAEHARGRLHTDDPQAAAGVLVSAMHSIALFEIMGFHGGAMPKAAVKALINAMWTGMQPVRRQRGEP
jgi:AcrR family transcriptional regulator